MRLRLRLWATPDLAGPEHHAGWPEPRGAGIDWFTSGELAGPEGLLRNTRRPARCHTQSTPVRRTRLGPDRHARSATLAPECRNCGAVEEARHGCFGFGGAVAAGPRSDLSAQRGLKLSHAIVCALLGFFLADTSMASTIQDGLNATAGVVGSLKP